VELDDMENVRALDPEGMLDHLDGLPEQLGKAWELGESQPLPERASFRQVIIAGMGGSAIGADLLAAYVAPTLEIPVIVWRSYDLPASVRGRESLVVVSSHSGNTEEALSAFERAAQVGATLVAVSTGGRLAERAEGLGVPVWRFKHAGQPRAAVGYSFGLLLSLLCRLQLIPSAESELGDAVTAMRSRQASLLASVPVVQNPAKRMAGQLMGRWPTILGAGILAPVARRWRTQISELAKAMAQFEELPEADHNLVAGVLNPQGLIEKTMVLFLRSSLDHPRNGLRIDATRRVLMVEGFNTDVVHATGETRLAHQWTCLHFGDYVAYYLAIAYGVDPTPVAAIQDLKQQMARGGA
jgi:glucose/mannose-6-phosphate isomerase